MGYFLDERMDQNLSNLYLECMLDALVDIYDSWSKGGRAKDLKQLAREYDMKYDRRVDFGNQPTDIKAFKVFKGSGIKRFMGVLETDLESGKGTARFYDYLRTKDLETYTRSVVEVYCEDVRTDYFKIVPKGIWNRTKNLFKSSSNIHKSAKAFHKRFYLETNSSEVQYTLNRKALDLLLDYPNINMEAKGHCFVFYKKKEEMDIDQIMPLLDFAEEVVACLGTGEDGGYV